MDQQLLDLLKNFENIFDTISIAIHINHESEISELFEKNIIPFQRFNLLSQSVLLKGVNDNVESLVNLYRRVNKLKIKPYYLHHPDLVKGAMHFYLPLEIGRQIYGTLRDELPGWLIPHYIIDSSLGTGKNLAYNSESLIPSGKILDRFGQTHPLDIQQ
jgi:lysine 2,3-aminomutase